MLSEVQCLVWLLSMPSCAEVKYAMQELTGINCGTSEQHKNSTPARIKRDSEDTYNILPTVCECDSFCSDPTLRGLVTGVVAREQVNIDDARHVGQLILDSMVGIHIHTYSFRCKLQAGTLGSKSPIRIDVEPLEVDRQSTSFPKTI